MHRRAVEQTTSGMASVLPKGQYIWEEPRYSESYSRYVPTYTYSIPNIACFYSSRRTRTWGSRKAICLQISRSTIDNSFQVDYFWDEKITEWVGCGVVNKDKNWMEDTKIIKKMQKSWWIHLTILHTCIYVYKNESPYYYYNMYYVVQLGALCHLAIL